MWSDFARFSLSFVFILFAVVLCRLGVNTKSICESIPPCRRVHRGCPACSYVCDACVFVAMSVDMGVGKHARMDDEGDGDGTF